MSMSFSEKHHDLQVLLGRLSKELPAAVSGFTHLHKDAVASGTSEAKFEALIALGIAVAIRCDDCIAYHVHDALKAGASHADIIETLGVTMIMGGGPAAMYACEAFEALQQYESKTAGR